ncbi:winged helix-turn-helix transcriptional regulator [Pseudomonas sp. NPDC007930]|uniref:winged helix-turn-helix transcriptional regulator n=1 Tax=Pseudomonas sp. NPDC007930 TaxID=3364417 RepID=UPI0036E30CA9
MQHTPLTHAECPIARSLEHVGEWWSMLIIRDALQGLRRFDEFSRSLGIAPNMLTRRLATLVAAGLLSKQAYQQRPLRYEYVPTAKAWDFAEVLMALISWGNRHYAPEGASVQVVDRDTGRPLAAAWVDAASGQLVPAERVAVRPGPAASEGMRERLKGLG